MIKPALSRLFAFTLLAFLAFSLASCGTEPSSTEVSDFAEAGDDTLANDVLLLQSDLEDRVLEAEDLLATTNVEELLDPQTLDSLGAKVEEARALSSTVTGIIATEDSEQLTKLRDDLQASIDSLVAASKEVDASKQALIDKAEEERLAALDAIVTPSHTYTLLLTDTNGYQVEATIRLGDWIRGSETDTLQAAWAKVGGQGDMPLTAGKYSAGSYGGGYNLLDTDAAAYVFGTVSFANRTEGFSMENFAGGYLHLYSSPRTAKSRSTADLGMPAIAVTQYGSTLRSDATEVWGNSSLSLVQPDFQGDSWGPVPFVIALDNVFTPNYPEGDPQLDDIYFNVHTDALSIHGFMLEGDTEMRIGKTW
jgi:hypothetical protein